MESLGLGPCSLAKADKQSLRRWPNEEEARNNSEVCGIERTSGPSEARCSVFVKRAYDASRRTTHKMMMKTYDASLRISKSKTGEKDNSATSL